MIRSKRTHTNKQSHARRFKHDVGRTHKKNMMPPMRGGWRL